MRSDYELVFVPPHFAHPTSAPMTNAKNLGCTRSGTPIPSIPLGCQAWGFSLVSVQLERSLM